MRAREQPDQLHHRDAVAQDHAPRPVFALTIEYAGTPEFVTHGLRKLLKRLLRNHRFRCLSIEEIEGGRR